MTAVVERLRKQREELAQAVEQLAAAKEARDVKAVGRLTVEADTLREFIKEDERAHQIESEQLNATEGAALYHELLGEFSAAVEALDGYIESASTVVREAAKATAAVNDHYVELLWQRRALELLQLRYPNMGSGVAVPALRRPPNIAPVVFEIEDKTPDDVPRPVVVITASMTRQQKALAGYDGLRKFIEGWSKRLPARVREFFARAGVPDGVEAQTRRQTVDAVMSADDDSPAMIGSSEGR
jgi:hypothetical protein